MGCAIIYLYLYLNYLGTPSVPTARRSDAAALWGARPTAVQYNVHTPRSHPLAPADAPAPSLFDSFTRAAAASRARARARLLISLPLCLSSPHAVPSPLAASAAALRGSPSRRKAPVMSGPKLHSPEEEVERLHAGHHLHPALT